MHNTFNCMGFLLPLLYLLLLYVTLSASQSLPSVSLRVDEDRKVLGEKRLKEVQQKVGDSPCWKEAVSKLNSTCRLLSDIEQSRLAVAFANCHLGKSARQTYPCTDSMSIEECTKDMDVVGFQTYTEFFTHTGHICYFLQSELWQERTENVITRLSDTSDEAVAKLEEALEYHKMMDKKQNEALSNQDTILEQERKIASSLGETRKSMDQAFGDMADMAEKQKLLLSEMFGSLQSSIEAIRTLMSLFLVEFIGYETFATLVVSWLVILFLPQFGFSRLKLHFILFADLFLEIVIRRLYGYFVLGGATKSPPDSLEGLHTWLWRCRYASMLAASLVYVWEWLNHCDWAKRNSQTLSEIQSQNELIMGALGLPTPQQRRASGPSLGQRFRRVPTPSSPRHSWPRATGEVTPSLPQHEIPPGTQPILHPPLGLDQTDSPNVRGRVDLVDGGVIGSMRHQHVHVQPTGVRQPDSAYFFDPIAGLQPPVGHPLSPYTDPNIVNYIRSLHQVQSSSSSLVAHDSSSSDSDDTYVPSDDPMVRLPIRVRGSPSSRQSSLSPVRPNNDKNRINQLASTPCQRKHTKGRPRATNQPPNNSDLSNLSPTNLPVDDFEPEKEVSEEKEDPLAVRKEEGRGRRRKEERGRTKQRMSLEEQGTSAQDETSSRVQTQPVKRGRASMPPPSTPGRYNLRPRSRSRTPVASPR